ncbi:hypothetical protein [Halarchaeum nitratireducens]|uniref:hypothetical protein n=1 Tax=Halarchaeum nitratireducens TaxID=489913 RepID=UPI00166CD584|nr:hypothetical protein [Halarchaeum nitratireducens]
MIIDNQVAISLKVFASVLLIYHMDRVHLYVLVAGGLIVLAGCAATSSPEHLHVQQADGNISADNVVQFDELTPAQQRVFKDALQKGIADVPNNVSIDPWTHYRYVKYHNNTYEAVVSTA